MKESDRNSRKANGGFITLPPNQHRSDEPGSMLQSTTRLVGTWTKRLYRRVSTLLTNRKFASTTYRFLARQIATDLKGMEGTPKIVFSSTGDLALNSEILLMLAYFMQDELSCNVLLIDGTFRKGGISERLGLNNPIGFMDYLCSEHWTPNPLIASTVNSNVFVIPAGNTPSLRAEPLGRPLVESRLDEAAKGFSYVFIQQDAIVRDTRYLVFNEVADMVLLHAVERETRLHDLETCQKVYEDHQIHGVRLILSEHE